MKIRLLLQSIVIILCWNTTLFSQSNSLIYQPTASFYPSSFVSFNAHETQSSLDAPSMQGYAKVYNSVLKSLSPEQLAHFFAQNRWSENQILSNPELYARSAFLQVAKKLPSYPEYVAYYHEQYQSLSLIKKCVGRVTGSYLPCRAALFSRLYAGCHTTLNLRRAQTISAHQSLFEKSDRSPFNNDHPDVTAAREYARVQTQKEEYTRTMCDFKVSNRVADFAQTHGIARPTLERGMMTAYEKQLHTEFVEQLRQTETLVRSCKKKISTAFNSCVQVCLVQ